MSDRFGTWLVLGVPFVVGTHSRVLCRCDCGVEKEVRLDNLHSGRSTGCGCMRTAKSSAEPETMQQKIEELVEPVTETGCWIWMGRIGTEGYPVLWVNNKARHAHRLAFEAWHRPLRDGEWVLHKCDTRCCVNPAHLYGGNHADNMRDKAARLRVAGERNPNAHLTTNDVIQIRARRKAGEMYRPIATDYCISVNYATQICNRERWRLIP